MKKILIFEPQSSQALAVSKYIKKYSDYFVVGCTEKDVRFDRSNYDEVIVSNYLDVDITKYSYILPMGANSTYRVVNKYKELKYCNGIKFTDNNLIAFDKLKMLQLAQTLNIPIPKTFYDKNDIEAFPIFYKESFESGGGTRGIAKNANGIPNKIGLIYQEYIDTPSTYGVGFLAKDGEMITYTIHKEVISYPKEGGSGVVVEPFLDDRLLQYTSKLLNRLNYNGWGLAEFKYCSKRDDYIFMELNSKFWASVELMLNNNPLFLKLLLNINYTKNHVDRMLFINRLLKYDLKNFIINTKYILQSKIIVEENPCYYVIRRATPNVFLSIIKKVLH